MLHATQPHHRAYLHSPQPLEKDTETTLRVRSDAVTSTANTSTAGADATEPTANGTANMATMEPPSKRLRALAQQEEDLPSYLKVYLGQRPPTTFAR